MTEISVPFAKIRTMLAKEKIASTEMQALDASFRQGEIRQTHFENIVPMILCSWPKKRLKRALAKGRKIYKKEQKTRLVKTI
jgi:hypothetical protein